MVCSMNCIEQSQALHILAVFLQNTFTPTVCVPFGKYGHLSSLWPRLGRECLEMTDAYEETIFEYLLTVTVITPAGKECPNIFLVVVLRYGGGKKGPASPFYTAIEWQNGPSASCGHRILTIAFVTLSFTGS